MKRAGIIMAGSMLVAALQAAPADFGREVLPILSDHCFKCHGPDEKARKGKLRLDTKEGALRTEKPVLIAGKSSRSELIRRITSKDPDVMMPPPESKLKLAPAQIAAIKSWVDAGAAWSKHWAFEPPQRAALPAVKNTKWPRNEIDRFILARLELEGLQPSLEADKVTLLRRVSLDLTGLPPSQLELAAFLKDPSPAAYESAVDRMLASPRYGERMAWDWLDAARYADSNGYQGDGDRTMWPWRDWVVRSLNHNLPYNQFTLEQLAGDLLPNATDEQRLATGFNRNHMINGEGGRIAEENRIEYIFDQTETLGTIWLGMTFTCTRCHDHKFDPITQRDYFSLFAFFNNTPVTGGGGDPQGAPNLIVQTEADQLRRAELQQRFDSEVAKLTELEMKRFPREEKQTAADSTAAKELPEAVRKTLARAAAQRDAKSLDELVTQFEKPAPEYGVALKSLKAAIEARNGFEKSIPKVMVMAEMGKPRETRIFERGVYTKPTELVNSATPASLPAMSTNAPRNRLGLANWLLEPQHPLTARVTVNRHWQLFFGNGLVKTSEDFGVQGEKPSHPELLDWLAAEFVSTGWNVKTLHKRIVTSAAYRQSSKFKPALQERDPENRLIARAPRFRLPSWMIRDQALFVSGLLVERIGGPPVKSYQPEGIWAEATFGNKQYQQDHGESLYRRSLYTFWRRIVGPTIFFDVAKRQTCAVRTGRTNTPLHALITLNDVTYIEASRAMAQRVLREAGTDDAARISFAFQLATSRAPKLDEREVLLKRLDVLRREYLRDAASAKSLLAVGESKRDETLNPADHAAFTVICNLILNLDEVITHE